MNRLPNGWKLTSLRDLCDLVQYGYTAKASKQPVGPKFLRITDIVPERISWEDVPYCELNDSDVEKYLLQPGDIVIARTGATTGYAKRIKEAPSAIFASYLVRLRIKDVVDNRYIGLVVESGRYKRFIQTNISGSAQPNANAKILTSFPVPLPPLKDQQIIASILSAYDDLIENNTRRIKILEEMAQNLYREWFVNFRFPGHEKVKMVDSPLGKIPEGWEIVRFTDLFENYMGGGWGSEEANEKENCRVRVIRGTDFSDFQGGSETRAPLRYISPSSLTKRKLKVGDIIVENSVNASSRCVGTSLMITQGMIDQLGEDSICASFCKNFRLKKAYLSSLIYLRLKYLYSEGSMEFYQHIATNGIGNFQAKRFVESEAIILPSDYALLTKMLSVFDDLNKSVYAEKISNLRRTRDLLLPKLISGEVSV